MDVGRQDERGGVLQAARRLRPSISIITPFTLATTIGSRRLVADMDRTGRPDFATELERTRENLEFNQLDRASKAMRSISREMRRVVDAPDLRTLRQYGADLARDKRLRPKIDRLRRGKVWDDLGDLKRELLDLWTAERNDLAKRVILDIEAQRKEAPR